MSDLGRRLSEGEMVRGVGASTFAPAVVETAGAAGMDFVWLNFEHKGPSPTDSRILENLVRAAGGVETELLVRLPDAEPWLVWTVIDAGVSNLLLPRVEDTETVRDAISATRFEYDGAPGTRGASNSYASGWGEAGYEPAGDDPVVGVMLETAAAVRDLEEILAVPGLAFGYLGTADLSISLGHPFETDHPAVLEAIDGIAEACQAADVPLGRSIDEPGEVAAAVTDGCRLLRYGDELGALRRTLSEFETGLAGAKD